MDSQTTIDQGLNMPQPQPGGTTAKPSMPLPMPTMPLPLPPSIQPAVEPPLAHPVTDQTSVATPAGVPVEAADSDVIEKEWVVKAKHIVAETRQDPYKQVRELNTLKADYMKKRYSKDLKLPDA